MPQLPTSVPIGQDNGAFIWPYFSTNSVQVLREEEAFSFGSLVADVGGVLGLFIGFNFLMVWGWAVDFSTFALSYVFTRRIITHKTHDEE